jgi:hypothetical protein
VIYYVFIFIFLTNNLYEILCNQQSRMWLAHERTISSFYILGLSFFVYILGLPFLSPLLAELAPILRQTISKERICRAPEITTIGDHAYSVDRQIM